MLRMLSCFILLVGILIATNAFETDAGPRRTLEAKNCGEEHYDPCEISTYLDLTNIQHVGVHRHYILVEDIEAPVGVSFVPIEGFAGSFNGNGHAISGLHTSHTSSGGLFRDVTDGADISNLLLKNSVASDGAVAASATGGVTISNVTVENSYVNVLAAYGGGFVGYYSSFYDIDLSMHISNCHMRGGLVNGTGASSSSNAKVSFIGGLVGNAVTALKMEECSVEDTDIVVGPENELTSTCGGLLGKTDFGFITNSFSTGDILSCTNGGGLVGSAAWALTITNCYAAGDINLLGGTGGGLIGRFGGILGPYLRSIENCFSTGTVTGGAEGRVGGIMGTHGGGSDVQWIHTYCLMSPSSGSFRQVGQVVTTDAHRFYSPLHKPLKLWDEDVWEFNTYRFPALRSATTAVAQCSVLSCENSRFLKQRTKNMSIGLISIKSQLRRVSELEEPWRLVKIVNKATKQLVKKRPIKLKSFASGRKQLDDLWQKIGEKVEEGQISKKERKNMGRKIQGVLDDASQIEADCCDLV